MLSSEIHDVFFYFTPSQESTQLNSWNRMKERIRKNAIKNVEF